MLIEPYGHLSYKKLLDAMRESNFHTTIAFIPWNFDRSRREVVDLLRDSQTRISFCIHGNNHDHEEFADSKPLDTQEANIRQAIARMEMFKELTGFRMID